MVCLSATTRNPLHDETLMLTLTLDRLGGQYRAVITSQARADEDTSAGLSFFVAETLDEAMAGAADCLIAYFRACNERTATLARAEEDFALFRIHPVGLWRPFLLQPIENPPKNQFDP